MIWQGCSCKNKGDKFLWYPASWWSGTGVSPLDGKWDIHIGFHIFLKKTKLSKVLLIISDWPVRDHRNFYRRKIEWHYFLLSWIILLKFWLTFWILLSEVGLAMRIFDNKTANFYQARLTERNLQEVDHLSQNFSTCTKFISLICYCTKFSRNLVIMESTPEFTMVKINTFGREVSNLGSQ